jgi:hypothetical protein
MVFAASAKNMHKNIQKPTENFANEMPATKQIKVSVR